MPPAVAAAPWLVPAIVGATGITSAVISSRANNKAADTTNNYNQQALDYQKQKDAQDRADAQKLLDAQAAQYAANQARRAPYYAAAQDLLGQNAARLGLGSLPLWTGSSAPPSGTATASTANTSTTQNPNGQPTLSSLAGNSTSPTSIPGISVPQLTLNDVLSGSWSGRA